jgi:hypothetical protein
VKHLSLWQKHGKIQLLYKTEYRSLYHKITTLTLDSLGLIDQLLCLCIGQNWPTFCWTDHYKAIDFSMSMLIVWEAIRFSGRLWGSVGQRRKFLPVNIFTNFKKVYLLRTGLMSDMSGVYVTCQLTSLFALSTHCQTPQIPESNLQQNSTITIAYPNPYRPHDGCWHP